MLVNYNITTNAAYANSMQSEYVIIMYIKLYKQDKPRGHKIDLIYLGYYLNGHQNNH